MNDEIEETQRYLSTKDKDNLLYLQLSNDYLKKQLEEKHRGNQKYMSFEEVSAYAKEKNISMEQALEELVPRKLVEGF